MQTDLPVEKKPPEAREATKAKEPTWDLVVKRNSIERHKRERFPHDTPLSIVNELPDMIAKGYEAIPEEDIVFLSWWGLMHDKPKIGTFMVRIKVPGGRIKPDQLIALGRISQQRGKNYGELTTRQGIQLHWIRLDELPEVLGQIEASGLTTAGGEGDTVRNVTSCPVAGVDGAELFDVTPLVAKVAAFFSGNPEYSDLPRKHKYTISACPAQCNAPEIHDVALVGTSQNGRLGFGVRVGGGLSATPRISRDLGVFVPADSDEEVIEVLRAITDVWQSDLRYRLSRVKARIKFMVDDYGVEKMRDLIEDRLGRRLEDGSAPEPAYDSDHLGRHAQKQDGLLYMGIPVPLGWIRGDQLVALGELLGEFGGEARFTRAQNIIVTGVPERRAGEVAARLAAIGLDPDESRILGRSIACTDHQFCNYSVAETKGKMKDLLPELQRRFGSEAVEDLRIHMDGCPHGCAQHWVGDIGLQGTTATLPETGVRVQAYNLRLRGKLGTGAAIGVPILRRIPEEQIVEVVCRLVSAWLDAKSRRGGAYRFADFLAERSDDELRSLSLGESVGAGEVEEPSLRPLVRIPGMLIEATGGADLLEIDAATVREALAVLAGRYPRLAEQILDGNGELLQSINLFVGEDDIRGLGGLEAPLRPGQELTILPALSGGAL
ncbi:MAG TPA: MoaD/ThiS family protein [Acidimicrobiales bacterium]|nr:MoaD/ThiS family protein [Acidimicrobiales bacterium]